MKSAQDWKTFVQVFQLAIFIAQYPQFKSFGKIFASKALVVFYKAYRKISKAVSLYGKNPVWLSLHLFELIVEKTEMIKMNEETSFVVYE